MRETWVQSLCWEDPLEKGKATQSSIMAWRIPWTEESGGLRSIGLDKTEQLTHTHTVVHKSLTNLEKEVVTAI